MIGAARPLVQSALGCGTGCSTWAGGGVTKTKEQPPHAKPSANPALDFTALVRKRNEDTETPSGRYVIHDFFYAQRHALLLVNQVAHVEPQRQPLRQIELHAEAAGARQTDVTGLDRRSTAERQEKIVAADGAAHPAHLAVGQRPNQIAGEELHRVVF